MWIIRVVVEWFSVKVLSQYLSEVTLLVFIVVAENAEDAYTQDENECEDESTDNTSYYVYLIGLQRICMIVCVRCVCGGGGCT